MKKCLFLIPARGGSKRVPRKNIREVAGKPLILWTIEEAKKSKHIHRLVVSSDDEEILEISSQYCEVLERPKSLAKDNSSSIDVALHALKKLPGYDIVVLLQPTSPLRKAEDIDTGIILCRTAIMSVCNGKPNGAVFAARVDWFKKNKTFKGDTFEMPEERSLDIDEEADIQEADRILRGIL
jgi:CMP-N-acetylneuraminic acid synthetase